MSKYGDDLIEKLPENLAVAAVAGIPTVGGPLSVFVAMFWPSSNSDPLKELQTELIKFFEEKIVEENRIALVNDGTLAFSMLKETSGLEGADLYEEIRGLENDFQTLVPQETMMRLESEDTGIPYFSTLANIHLVSSKIKRDLSKTWASTPDITYPVYFNNHEKHIHDYCSRAIKAYPWALKRRLNKIGFPKIWYDKRTSHKVEQGIYLRWKDSFTEEAHKVKVAYGRRLYDLSDKDLDLYTHIDPIWTKPYEKIEEETRKSLEDFLIKPAKAWIKGLEPITERATFLMGKWTLSRVGAGKFKGPPAESIELYFHYYPGSLNEDNIGYMKIGNEYTQKVWVDYNPQSEEVQFLGLGYDVKNERQINTDYYFQSFINLKLVDNNTALEGNILHSEWSGINERIKYRFTKEAPLPYKAISFNSIDAAIKYSNHKTYLFSGSQYIRFDHEKGMDRGYPKPITKWKNWPREFTKGIDAALMHSDGNAYFFKGSQYIKYEPGRGVPGGYPKSIVSKWDNWPTAFNDGIDAALTYSNGKIYFFKGNQYIRCTSNDRIDRGYPKPIKGNWKKWPDEFTEGIDAAFLHLGAYFFKKDEYINQRPPVGVLPVYPKPISKYYEKPIV